MITNEIIGVEEAFNTAIQFWNKLLGGIKRIVFWNMISRYLSEDISDRLKGDILLISKEQIEAETALITLLQKEFSSEKRTQIKTNRITRNTDWSKTVEKNWPNFHQSYVDKPIETIPDKSVISSLVLLALQFCNLLNKSKSKNCKNRSRQLYEAIEGYLEKDSRLSSFNPWTIDRIKHVDKNAYTKLVHVYEYWNQPVRENDFKKALAWFNENDNYINETESKLFANENLALEFIVESMIVREACNQGWKIDKKSLLIQIQNYAASVPSIILNKDDIVLRIGKGDSLLASEDRINWLRKKLIYTVRGNQPDIVLSFERDGRKVTVIGDAKNNTGEIYIGVAYDAALVYALSFGDKSNIDIQYNSNGTMEVSSDVFPFVTLFFAKDVKYQKDIEDIGKYLENKIIEDRLLVMSLDLSHIAEENDYVLDSWFKTIEAQAIHKLNERNL